MTSRSPEFAIFFLVLFLSSGCGSLRATPAHSRSLVYHRMMMPLEPLRMSMEKKVNYQKKKNSLKISRVQNWTRPEAPRSHMHGGI